MTSTSSINMISRAREGIDSLFFYSIAASFCWCFVFVVGIKEINRGVKAGEISGFAMNVMSAFSMWWVISALALMFFSLLHEVVLDVKRGNLKSEIPVGDKIFTLLFSVVVFGGAYPFLNYMLD